MMIQSDELIFFGGVEINHQLANGEKADLSIVNGGYKPTNRIKEAELELHPQVLKNSSNLTVCIHELLNNIEHHLAPMTLSP